MFDTSLQRLLLLQNHDSIDAACASQQLSIGVAGTPPFISRQSQASPFEAQQAPHRPDWTGGPPDSLALSPVSS